MDVPASSQVKEPDLTLEICEQKIREAQGRADRAVSADAKAHFDRMTGFWEYLALRFRHRESQGSAPNLIDELFGKN